MLRSFQNKREILFFIYNNVFFCYCYATFFVIDSPSEKETQRQTILYFWNNGVHSAKELHALTNIPISTIYYNIEKLKKTGEVSHKGGNG